VKQAAERPLPGEGRIDPDQDHEAATSSIDVARAEEQTNPNKRAAA
jgi:hypothetical protein